MARHKGRSKWSGHLKESDRKAMEHRSENNRRHVEKVMGYDPWQSQQQATEKGPE